MRIMAAFLLCVTLLMPFTLYSEDYGPDNVLIHPQVSEHLKGIDSSDLVAMGPKPSAPDTCKCWACP